MAKRYSLSEIARAEGVTTESVRRWILFHGLPAERVGTERGYWIVEESDLREFLRNVRPTLASKRGRKRRA